MRESGKINERYSFLALSNSTSFEHCFKTLTVVMIWVVVMMLMGARVALEVTNYSSALTSDHWTFQRPGGYRYDYYYDVILIEVRTEGNYTIESESDVNLDGFLYSPAFLPTSPSSDLIASDTQFSRRGQFQLMLFLELTHRYFLVVTTSMPSVTADYKLTVAGPAAVELIPIISNRSTIH